MRSSLIGFVGSTTILFFNRSRFSVTNCLSVSSHTAKTTVPAVEIAWLTGAAVASGPSSLANAAAFDVVYVPELTPFIAEARARGLRTVTGNAMFLAQAAATFERWFGFAPKDTPV